jgi:hypothetical protein
MQFACDLMYWSAVRAETQQYRTYREQLQNSIRQLAGGIYVAATTLNEANVANIAKDVAGRAMQQQVDLVALIHPLCEQIPHMKGFEEVRPPQPPQQVGPQGQGNTTASDGGAAPTGNISGATVQQAR